MRKLFSSGVIALSVLTLAATPDPMPWNVDASHSGIEFSVKHFFTPVRGQFDDYQIDLVFDREQPAHSSVSVRIAVASVNTGNEDRDEHLLSGDFFDAERYPYITFESEQVWQTGTDELLARGDLTIKEETHQVELPIKMLGIVDVPDEMKAMLNGVDHIASFETGLQIDRSDFGVGAGSWAAALVVGHEVDIDIAVEANR